MPVNNATGNYGAHVTGPYGTGFVGSNGFIGPAQAFLPPSISDPLAGRVAPDTVLRFETWDGKVEAAGTPDQLIPQIQALLTVNHQRQGGFASNNTSSGWNGPILVLPDNIALSFPDDSSLANYVYRSHDPLPAPTTPVYAPPPPTPAPPPGSNVPDSTLAGTFQDTLGRPAGPDDMASMRGSLQGGATVQDIRNYLAGSQEAKNTLWFTFYDALNRPPEPDNMTGMQNTLTQGGSQAGVRTYLAGSQEAKNDMWIAFDQVLDRPPDPNNLVGMQNMLAQPGATQHDVRVFLASTQEAKNDVWSLIYNELGREAQQGDLDLWQGQLAGGISLAQVRTALAYSPDAGGKIDTMYHDMLSRPGDLPGIQFWQGQLANGASLAQVRTAFAYSPEATVRIGDLYTLTLGRAPEPGATSTWEAQLDAGATLAQIQVAIAASPEAIQYQQLKQFFIAREGYRNDVYLDSEGIPTVGIGHKVLPGDNLRVSDVIDDFRVNALFAADSATATDAARSQMTQAGITDPLFLPYLASVNFQVGPGWIYDFKVTWADILAGNYEQAAIDFADSKLYSQSPNRVEDFQDALRRLPPKTQ